jgi:hypothetical protein
MRGRKNKTMKGGFWDKITDMFKTKPKTPITTTTTISKSSIPSSSMSPSSSMTPSTNTTTMTPSTTTTTPSTSTTTTMGGRRTRRHKGGYSASHSINNLASRAAPFSGSKTAQPQVWLGGKSRKLRTKKRSSKRRHRR